MNSQRKLGELEVRLSVILTFSYLGGVFYLGLTPLSVPPKLDFHWHDKVAHLLVFGGLQTLLLWFLKDLNLRVHGRRGLYLSFVGASFFGGLLEVLQSFVPHRSAEWLDFLADALGASLGALICSSFFTVSDITKESSH